MISHDLKKGKMAKKEKKKKMILHQFQNRKEGEKIFNWSFFYSTSVKALFRSDSLISFNMASSGSFHVNGFKFTQEPPPTDSLIESHRKVAFIAYDKGSVPVQTSNALPSFGSNTNQFCLYGYHCLSHSL